MQNSGIYLNRETDYEIVYDPKTYSFWQKIVWTFKIWFGFKHKIKQKVRKVE
jgi:hypothetical protein